MSGFQIRPADDEAVAIASAREPWTVSEEEILDERIAHIVGRAFERMNCVRLSSCGWPMCVADDAGN